MRKFIQESWLVLVMGVLFATLLAGAQTSLADRIAENRARALREAIAEVVPEVSASETLTIDGTRVYRCRTVGGALSGWAVDATGPGFVDKIRIVVGLSPDAARVTGIKVIENVETPGLGNKIEGAWAGQYAGRDAARPLRVVKRSADLAANEIQAITGATYSSNYVTDIVNEVLTAIRPRLQEQ